MGPGNPPEVDLAVMTLCQVIMSMAPKCDSEILVVLRFQLYSMLFLPQETIVDYGTFSLWGALLNGGQVVTSTLTFRDCLWAGKYFGWTFL